MELIRPSYVLQRRINTPLERIERALRLAFTSERDANVFTGCSIAFDGGFAFVPSWPGHCWRAHGTLVNDTGRTVARVEVELGMWSEHATELSLRPVSSRPQQWGRRRQMRYFDNAHRACDEMLALTKRMCAPVETELSRLS